MAKSLLMNKSYVLEIHKRYQPVAGGFQVMIHMCLTDDAPQSWLVLTPTQFTSKKQYRDLLKDYISAYESKYIITDVTFNVHRYVDEHYPAFIQREYEDIYRLVLYQRIADSNLFTRSYHVGTLLECLKEAQQSHNSVKMNMNINSDDNMDNLEEFNLDDSTIIQLVLTYE